MERWVDIPKYEGLYQVSNLGRVKTLSRVVTEHNGKERHLKEKVLKGGIYPNGYKFICLRKNDENKNIMVHRLVAQTFIPNPYNKPCVNHIDGNKLNNRVENLEWCTPGENLKHAVNIGLVTNQCKIMRKVKVITPNNQMLNFNSMKDCCSFFGFKKGWLQNRIRKHGLNFYYKEHKIEVFNRGGGK